MATALLKFDNNGPYYVAAYVAFAGVVSLLSAWWILRHPAKEGIATASATTGAELEPVPVAVEDN